jgi:starch-binding outer membrane protein, SusD/RagB family
MKYLLLILLLLLGLLSACSEEFLDRAPLDTINTANYPTNAEELTTVVNGAYQPLQWPKL